MSKKKKENDSDIKVTCLHVDNEVTGSAFQVQIKRDNKKELNLLFDMGLYQNQSKHLETIYKINEQRLLNPMDKIDYIILTSSHADHVAGLGIAGRKDSKFKGQCICTELTQELIALNLYDSAFLMENECEAYLRKYNKEIKPLYTKYDVDHIMSCLRGYGYNEKIYLTNEQDIYIELLSNGHLSGDASIYLTVENGEYDKKTILYLGDHNYGKKKPKPFTKVWENRVLKPTCILTEATYASELQPKNNPIDDLEKYIVSEVVEKRNTIILPSFAIHRSTELAYMLKVIWDRNEKIRNSDIPIYMCGLMMSKAHKIIGNPKFKSFYDEEWQNQDELFMWDRIKGIDNFKELQSKTINQNPKVIIASGGMITSYSKYLLTCYITQKNCSILFTGFQCLDTMGRKLLEQIHKTISIDGKPYIIRANILGKLEGLSGHADDKGLRGIFQTLNLHNLKKVLIVHGEDARKQVLKEELEDDLPDKVEVIVPKSRQVIKI